MAGLWTSENNSQESMVLARKLANFGPGRPIFQAWCGAMYTRVLVSRVSGCLLDSLVRAKYLI